MEQHPDTALSTSTSFARVLLDAREQAARDVLDGIQGSVLVARFSEELCQRLIDRCSVALRDRGDALAGAALVAVGGLARAETCPYSDLDLVLLTPYDELDGQQLEALARDILHPVWDSGLKAQLNLRTADRWLEDAVEDLTACSSLLDLRYLAGSREIVESLRKSAHKRFFGEKRGPFLERLRDEVRARHRRYGTTIYRVEPDLKHGPGGVRDLAIIGWALQATFGTRDFAALEEETLLGTRAVSALARARNILLRLRTALHLAAGRAQERLVFQQQERLPQMLGMVGAGADDTTLVSAIEDFMQSYFRSALDVLRHGKRVFLRCAPESPQPDPPERLDERFFVKSGYLQHYGDNFFRRQPVLALEALRLARRRRVRLAPATADAIIDALADADASTIRQEPEAQRLFIDILSEPEDTGSPSTLELCHELGLLERLVPEFGPSRGRMQHEGFHVYTVDQHSLFAVDFLKSLARGEHRKNYPLATAVHLGVEDHRVLYLATLLHDAGKAFGDQCAEGARIAEEAARRAGFDEASVKECAYLVREHMQMPMVSQKRDLSDPLEIERFAKGVEHRARLDALYLISLADMANVSPSYLTNWKLALLDELYLLTLAYFASGRRETLRARAIRNDEPQGLPERYYSLFDVALRREHRALLDRVWDDELMDGVRCELDGALGSYRLTVVAPDRRGMLAILSGALDDGGVDIVAADVFSAPGSPTLALDIFRIEPRGSSASSAFAIDQEWLTRIEQEIRRRLKVEHVQSGGAPRRHRRRFSPSLRREGRSQIRFESDPAGARTIIEIQTHSTRSVLRSVAEMTAQLGIDIDLARLSTHDNYVDLVLYVDRLETHQREALAQRIEDALSQS